MRKHVAIIAAAGAAAVIGGVIVISIFHAGDNEERNGDGMGFYKQTNLVSNRGDQGATSTDGNLQNPWGMAWAPGGAAWVANNGTRTSTLYTGEGHLVPGPPPKNLVVEIPDAPTGLVWNPVPGQFRFHDPDDTARPGSTVAAAFLFSGEEGKISAWSPDLINTKQAVVVVPASKPAAVYKGLAFGTNSSNFIFATNFAAGEVEVYDSNFKEISHDGKHGKMFHDPQMPKDYAPFGIANINEDLFVTFAKRSKDKPREEEEHGDGLGIVDVFKTNGELIHRFASHHRLNAPWGVTMATKNFGKFAGAILIGNFGNGQINAFDYRSGNFLGTLERPDGKPLVIEGLWSLGFGNFSEADTDELYFTAGINDEADGLFGEIAPVSRKKD
ncbi:MAG TPA: TIGR03118 family protein [Kofleriaceae bacterium]|jgi:uncharacterized protein (TIGR03118 family)|nr:TIGR03118 family protein [Kofleriaceae bacterium]